jgi:hypothetical protein
LTTLPTATTSSAQTPHSPRWQSEIPSKPAAFSASSIELFCGTSTNRARDPIVAEKRPDYYAINYPELQARIEIAHRPLIEVNDAARR